MRALALPALVFLAGCSGGLPTTPSAPSAAPSPTPASTPAPSPPATTPSPTPPPSTSVVLRSARIQGSNGHSAAGTAEIVREGGSHSLELRRDFRIDIGSVDVYLTRAPASNADGLNLGSLKSLTGAQGFRMPNDGSAFGYVLLWCRPFRVPVAMGELR